MRWVMALGLVLCLMLSMVMGVGVALADDETITVTATGSYVDISLTGGNWTMNSGNPIAVNAWRYSNLLGETTAPSNPVVNGECTHTITNDGSVAVDVTVKWDDMTGTGDPWVNSDDGSNGSMIFGAKAQASGANWSAAVVAKESSPYNTLTSSLAALGTKKVVFGFNAPTAFTDANAKSGDITLTASQA
jgi:hypothetical protein